MPSSVAGFVVGVAVANANDVDEKDERARYGLIGGMLGSPLLSAIVVDRLVKREQAAAPKTSPTNRQASGQGHRQASPSGHAAAGGRVRSLRRFPRRAATTESVALMHDDEVVLDLGTKRKRAMRTT